MEDADSRFDAHNPLIKLHLVGTPMVYQLRFSTRSASIVAVNPAVVQMF
jgi:hypothetical protein